MSNRKSRPPAFRHPKNQLPQLAAKLLADGTARDFGIAKRKAAALLGISDQRDLPDNQTVLVALVDYQRLFDSPAVTARNSRLRTAALEAMTFFADFCPALVGAVMRGSTLPHSAVSLHLFADEVEAVSRFLLDKRVAYQISDVRLRINRREQEQYPVFEIWLTDIQFQLVVMPTRRLANPPLSPLDGAPYRRLGATQLAKLVASANPGAPWDEASVFIDSTAPRI
ncbi:MAG: hypothetical protein HYX63_18480 [Gammaproteobacteria bacterium]|nr:hypothetical protein [Gammaproteobacteria bacterium]